VKSGKYVKQWPRGNLALMQVYIRFFYYTFFVIAIICVKLIVMLFKQYLYWEKVQPQIDDAITPTPPLRPLMRNWTEMAATQRDAYDAQHGRGHGKVRACN
jgi:hypothetical protein